MRRLLPNGRPQFTLKLLLVLISGLACITAVIGPRLADWLSPPKPIWTPEEMREILEEWEERWYEGGEPEEGPPHGGVI